MPRPSSIVIHARKWLIGAALTAPLACSGTDPAGDGATGGVIGAGGSSGASTLGGATSGGALTTGGVATSGGAPVTSGGAMTSGGAAVAGANTGGSAMSSGGAAGSGGTTGGGGTSAGASGTATTGGTATGGASTGGVSTGGAGGATQGGTSTGGTSGGAGGKGGSGGTTGGTATGGTSTGGSSTGGTTSALCPPGITKTITVAKDGSGQFTSIKAALDSIALNSTEHIRIDLKDGTYTEKITIEKRSNLCMVGASATGTIIAYGDNNAAVGSTSGTFTVLVSANDFSAANLTIQNTFGSGSQAVALRTTGQRDQFLNCRFVGYQDTLYTHQGTQYFKNCYVQGNTDYVFGGATAVLQNCEVKNVEGGSAVAAPNTPDATAYGIVFLGGKFTAVSGIKANSVALGRPWGAAGFGAYLNVELGAHIAAAGFVPMSENQPQNARFHEYGSTGSGANAGSRSSYQLTAQQAASYTLGTILAGWTPSYSQ